MTEKEWKEKIEEVLYEYKMETLIGKHGVSNGYDILRYAKLGLLTFDEEKVIEYAGQNKKTKDAQR